MKSVKKTKQLPSFIKVIIAAVVAAALAFGAGAMGLLETFKKPSTPVSPLVEDNEVPDPLMEEEEVPNGESLSPSDTEPNLAMHISDAKTVSF